MSLAADAARWQRRVAARQCGRCADPLPDGYTRTSCAACLAEVAEYERKKWWRVRGIVPPPRGRLPTLGQRRMAAEFAKAIP